MMLAHQISVGNELLLGDTINTNASWISQRLSEHGIRCVHVATVPDDKPAILSALAHSMRDADVTILTGGLGPTHDDITKTCLCEYFNARLVCHKPTLDRIQRMFEARGIPFSPSNTAQADVPEHCDVLFNSQGTAPGMWFAEKGKVLIVLPGVPREMKHLMTDEVLPRLRAMVGASKLNKDYLQLTGIGESTLSDLVIGDVSSYLKPGIELAYLPHAHGITLRITSFNGLVEDAARLKSHILSAAGPYVYSELPDVDLEQVVVQLASEKKVSIATAESCTGGWISNLITNVPGSSTMFKGSIVAYHNSVKQHLLDVPESVLMEYGAVSKQVALIMAKSAASKLGADIGISTTGIAGPDGGTEAKPVGLVWIGFWSRDTHFAVYARFFRDRILNKERTAKVALEIIRRQMLGIPGLPFDLKPESA